ncbi:hypothetical protein [Kordiimonas lacus]|uniref:Uncharacterized protein n=1 Tax=Kordiimonas lacus TaxID=637679 RepID=A0A1G7E7J4_9PROT|nr:hypothetical protein [Kordiimonas lacus]SDE59688.1 hypothetical protein SAMN04488071_3323 [Kordiimonas lacus]
MTKMLHMMPVTPGTRREGMEAVGVIAGFGLVRHSDGRLPQISRRSRRMERQRRLN